MKKRESILLKVLIPNSAIIVLVFFAASTLMVLMNTRLTMEREHQSVEARLTSAISSVDNQFRDMARVSLICYSDENTLYNIRNYKDFSYIRRLESDKYLQNLLLSLITIRNDITGVYIFDNESLIYHYDNYGLGANDYYSVEDAFWYPQDTDSQGEYLSGCKLTVGPLPEFLKPSRKLAAYQNQNFLYMTRAVNSFSPRERVGSIVLLAPVSELQSTIEQYLGKDDFYLVVNQEGIVVCEPEGLATGQPIGVAFPGIAVNMPEKGEQLTQVTIGDTEYMLGSLNSPYSGLTYMIGRPKASLFANTRKIAIMILLLSVMAVFVSIALTLFSTRRSLKPIQRLSEAMGRVGPGTTSSISLPVEGKDEISNLTAAFNQMMETINDLIFSEYENTIHLQESEIRQREIQLLYLRSQINPHFLYNTLDTIRMKAAMEGNDEVAELILMLVDFFRFSIGYNSATVSLSHEVQLMQIYLKLMKYRYPNISDSYDVDKTLNSLTIPNFIIQPLVENSIRHGLKQSGYKGHIQLRVYKDPQHITDVLIEVIDNGAGMSDADKRKVEGLLENSGSNHAREHFGVSNIQDRLRNLYPESLGLEIIPNEERGVTARIRIDTTVSIDRKLRGMEENDEGMG